MKTIEDFQKFQRDNNIQSPKDFKTRFKPIYNQLIKLKLTDKLLYTEEYEMSRERLKFIQSLNTVEDFQKFIDDNKIDSRTSLREKYGPVYYRMLKTLSLENRDSLRFEKETYHKYSEEEISIDFINRYIEENNIQNPKELRKINPSLYDVICRRLSKEEKSKLIYPNKTADFSSYKDFESIQEFVIENNVINRKDFHRRFPGLYIKYLIFRESWDKDLSFIESPIKYTGERLIAVELIKRGVNFITQKTYPNLKLTEALRFDFYLPEYNILIEHQGEAHFGKGRYYSEDLIKSDKLKYEFAKQNNIKLLYFTVYKSDYQKLGYFAPVIIEIEDLINSIDPNLIILENAEELVNEYFKT